MSAKVLYIFGSNQFGLTFPDQFKSKKITENFILSLTPELVITNLEPGPQLYAAKVCYKIGVPYEAVPIYEDIHKTWPDEIKKEYLKAAERASSVKVPSGHKAWHIDARKQTNIWAINKADVCLGFSLDIYNAYGVGSAAMLAKKLDKKMYIITHNDLSLLGYKK